MHESFFGLTANPFRLSPDPSFLFESRGHGRAYAYLKYGVSEGEGFIVITGDIGAGKTTLTQVLLRELDPEKVVAAHLVSTRLEADDLLRSVAAAFGLPVEGADKSRLINSVHDFLLGLVPQGRRALLIVDEAQNLTPGAIEELRMLSNFQERNRPLLQSFLVGQPELREKLRSPSLQQFAQRVIASCHLGPIEFDETRAYIEHRLKHVGWSGDPVFEADATPKIYRATGGIPRKINALCNRLLIRAYLDRRHGISGADVDAALAELEDEFGIVSAEGQGAEAGGEGRAGASGARGRAPPLTAISARLDHLEKSVSGLVELARSLSGPDGRGRFGSRNRRG